MDSSDGLVDGEVYQAHESTGACNIGLNFAHSPINSSSRDSQARGGAADGVARDEPIQVRSLKTRPRMYKSLPRRTVLISEKL
jgi:hypothetical protein